MKRVSLLMLFIFSVIVANAWHRKCDEAIVIVATKYLTPEAKTMVKRYLGKSYSDDVQYLYDTQREEVKQDKLPKGARTIHDLHLDENFKPKDLKYDSYKATAEALEIIRNRKAHSKEEVTTALRVVINLMCDMHNISKIRIDGYPHSYKNFTFNTPRREWGRYSTMISTNKWRESWTKYDGGFYFFTVDYWVEDMEAFLEDNFEKYAKGTLLDWIADNGAKAAYYLDLCKPDALVPYMEFKKMGIVNYEMMIKASCRLSTLLNEVASK